MFKLEKIRSILEIGYSHWRLEVVFSFTHWRSQNVVLIEICYNLSHYQQVCVCVWISIQFSDIITATLIILSYRMHVYSNVCPSMIAWLKKRITIIIITKAHSIVIKKWYMNHIVYRMKVTHSHNTPALSIMN